MNVVVPNEGLKRRPPSSRIAITTYTTMTLRMIGLRAVRRILVRPLSIKAAIPALVSVAGLASTVDLPSPVHVDSPSAARVNRVPIRRLMSAMVDGRSSGIATAAISTVPWRMDV